MGQIVEFSPLCSQRLCLSRCPLCQTLSFGSDKRSSAVYGSLYLESGTYHSLDYTGRTSSSVGRCTAESSPASSPESPCRPPQTRHRNLGKCRPILHQKRPAPASSPPSNPGGCCSQMYPWDSCPAVLIRVARNRPYCRFISSMTIKAKCFHLTLFPVGPRKSWEVRVTLMVSFHISEVYYQTRRKRRKQGCANIHVTPGRGILTPSTNARIPNLNETEPAHVMSPGLINSTEAQHPPMSLTVTKLQEMTRGEDSKGKWKNQDGG